jgi:F-type H+-transporting ATPase subunit a
VSEVKIKRRFGTKRWIILALIGLGIYFAYIGPTIFSPIAPWVVLPAEPTGLSVFGFPITNTILATLIADVILILIALVSVRGFVRSGSLVPAGFYNAFEAIFGFLWDSVESVAGKWAKRIIPVVATIFLLIFVANMIKMIPGFESIGYLKEAHHGRAFAPVQVGGLPVYVLDRGQPVEVEAHEGEQSAEGGEAHGEASKELCHACELVPYLRGSATDLNFTLALAISAVVFIQVIGVWALGPGYFLKFFQIGRLVSGGIFGIIDFAVGFLELILEFAKILSFAFRLFGNIFAGVLLLSILGALLPVILPPGLYLFEVFFGTIQAYVFFLLATVFMNMATVGHGGDHSEEHH